MKHKLPLILALAISGSLAAAPARLVLVDGDIRPAIELSGPWHWSVDPYRDGIAGFHGCEAHAAMGFDEGWGTCAEQLAEVARELAADA